MAKAKTAKKKGERRKVEEELRKLERLKEDIISNISHELKTPISVSLGAVELALEESNPAEIKKLMGIAKGAILRQKVLIENIISSIYVKQSEYSFDFNPVAVKEVIERAVKSIAHKAREKSIKIEIFVEKGLELNVSEKQFELAIYNLLDNAIKFNKRGGKIKISARKAGGLTKIIVHDTGIGIHRRNHGKIFEKFFQIDQSITRVYNGAGIGLSIAREIVEAHGGKILVESKPEKGSRFTIIL